MVAYLTGIGSITTPSKDTQENVENTQDNHSDVNRFVFVKISVGEDILPVHRHWQGQKTAGKGGQMSGKALCLIIISQWSNLKEIACHTISNDLKVDGEQRNSRQVRQIAKCSLRRDSNNWMYMCIVRN